jgi:hypothetical protein
MSSVQLYAAGVALSVCISAANSLGMGLQKRAHRRLQALPEAGRPAASSDAGWRAGLAFLGCGAIGSLGNYALLGQARASAMAGITVVSNAAMAHYMLGEQLSAMEMMAVDPIRRILAPRLWGGVIAMPFLAAVFSAVGIAGGWMVGVLMIGIDAGSFWSQMQGGVDLFSDIGNGLIKSVVFGVAVTFIALYQGYEAKPTPEGVSQATTRTVVISSLSVLALDFLLTAMMFSN